MPITGSQKADANVFVVINGKILLRDHHLNDPYNYNVMQVATSGAIIGVNRLDLQNSCRATVWSIVASNVAHVVEMTRETFDTLWRESLTRE